MNDDGALEQKAFESLDALLNDTLDVLEIEILPSALSPPGQSPFVRDGRCVGISKKMLILGYKHALIQIQSSSSGPYVLSMDPHVYDENTIRASSVILLLSPEHLTAANCRKRYILSIANPSTTLIETLAAELRFLDTLLTSPLPRHTKSPTLWAHRSWLLTSFSPRLLYKATQQGLYLEQCMVLDLELLVIQRAAEHHPHNYYAFDYLRKLITQILSAHQAESSEDVSERPGLAVRLARQAILVIRRFCQSHPSDTSAWSALLFILKIAEDEGAVFGTVKEVLRIATDMHWKGEAAWGFVRVILANDIPMRSEFVSELVDTLHSIILEFERNALDTADPPASNEIVQGMDLAREEATLTLRAARRTLKWVNNRKLPKP